MQRWKSSLLILAVAALCMAQSATEYDSPEVNRLAGQFNCSCGCKQTMACQMQPKCGVCSAAKHKILAMQKAGNTDQQIKDAFVAEYGPDVLVVRPGIMGVVGPYAALAVGLGMVLLAIRYYLRPRRTAVAEAAAPSGSDPLLDRYQDQIEKDLAKLD